MTVFAQVVTPGVQTTVQDLPGRTGFWKVGVPPSGAWDRPVVRAGQRGGRQRAGRGRAGGRASRSEAAIHVRPRRSRSPARHRRRRSTAYRCRSGAPITVSAGQVLDLGAFRGPGLRGYLAVRGGIAVDRVIGSALDVPARQVRRSRTAERSRPATHCPRVRHGGIDTSGRRQRSVTGPHERLGDPGRTRAARRAGAPDRRWRRRVLRLDVARRSPRRPDRDPAGRTGAAVGPGGRRRRRAASEQHPRQRVPGRGGDDRG